jgi:hypothetical protein
MCDIVWLWASTVIVILKDLMEHHTTLEPNFHNHTSCKIAESPKTAGIPSGAFAFVLPMCYGTGPGMSRAGWRFIPGRPRWVSKQPRDLWSLPEIETKAARVSSHRPTAVAYLKDVTGTYSLASPQAKTMRWRPLTNYVGVPRLNVKNEGCPSVFLCSLDIIGLI